MDGQCRELKPAFKINAGQEIKWSSVPEAITTYSHKPVPCCSIPVAPLDIKEMENVQKCYVFWF